MGPSPLTSLPLLNLRPESQLMKLGVRLSSKTQPPTLSVMLSVRLVNLPNGRISKPSTTNLSNLLLVRRSPLPSRRPSETPWPQSLSVRLLRSTVSTCQTKPSHHLKPNGNKLMPSTSNTRTNSRLVMSKEPRSSPRPNKSPTSSKPSRDGNKSTALRSSKKLTSSRPPSTPTSRSLISLLKPECTNESVN